jgi:hypothetical protein
MDNKYGLGSNKVAHEHHDAHHKPAATMNCRYCGSTHVTLCSTMHDHRCEQCGKWQNDIPSGYSTGRSADY